MIPIIIFSCIGLTTALFLMGFMCYHIIKMSRLLTKLNRKLIQNEKIIQLFNKKITDLKSHFEEQFEALKVISKKPTPAISSSSSFVAKEVIEQNYERAKNLIERGVTPDRELMESCNMTEEELELLAGLPSE
jgi:hypothetical protein